MRHHVIAACAISAVVLGTGAANAQDTLWGDNGFIALNGTYQTSATTFTSSGPLTRNSEQGTLTTTHKVVPGPVYDISAGGKIKGNLGVGYAMSYFRQTASGQISAGVPHPFYFNQLRGVTGESDLQREDLAIHLHAMWLFPISDAFQVAVFGGPTYFRVKQQMVEDVQISEVYPYDEAHFTGATATEEHGSKLGYNAGIDVSVFFSEHIGIGGLVRVSRAKVSMPSPNGYGVTLDAGGVQTGAGLRVRF